MTGAGPETEQADIFMTTPGMSDRLDPGSSYFDGFGLDELTDESRERFGLLSGNTVTRHSYLYETEYPINRKGEESEFGKIECRGWTWSHREELPQPVWEMVEAAAHRSAQMIDNGVHGYPSGYLTGFNSYAAGGTRDPQDAYESEKIAVDEEGALGAVVWSVEIYDEDGRLRGVAQGTAHPWIVNEEEVAGEPAVSVAPHKWNISFNDAREQYQVMPPGRTEARERYKPGGAAHDKTVYVNGKPIGKLDEEGRTWLMPEYGIGDGLSHRGYWSREGLVQETEGATYAALRKGGTLYLTGEDEEKIDLVTARAKPPGYRAADPDDVSPDVQVRAGSAGGTRRVLGIRDTDTPLPIECRRDDKIINAMGMSNPTYRRTVRTGWYV